MEHGSRRRRRCPPHKPRSGKPQPQIYAPTVQFARESSLAVRSSLPPAAMANEIRLALKGTDPDVTLSDVRTMGDLVSIASARRRFQTSLLTAFAIIALLLALIGLYGLMAFSVNRRTREVGIRMALGAERSDVLLLILRNAAALVGTGLLAGLACTWLATRALKSFLFGVSEHDPLTVVSISLLLLVCGLVAALFPAGAMRLLSIRYRHCGRNRSVCYGKDACIVVALPRRICA